MTAPDPDDPINIGSRLRRARVARRLSQRELARKSGVTNGLISQIEQNLTSPSVASLKRILDAIPISLPAFFAESFDAELPAVYPSGSLPAAPIDMLFPDADAGVSLRRIGGDPRKTLSLLHLTLAPGAETGVGTRTDSDIAGWLLGGGSTLTLRDQTHSLAPGDAFFFDARLPHRFANPQNVEAVILCALAPRG